MMKSMMIKGLMTLSVAMLPLTARALDYGLSVTSVIDHQSRSYEQQGELGSFVQKHGRAELKTQIRGQGPLALFNQEETKVDESVPGIRPQGHSLLRLEPSSAGVIAHVDVLVEDRVNGVPVRAELRYDAPLRWVSGSWVDFQNGQDVVLEYTPEGWAVVKKAIASFLTQTASQVRNDLDRRARALGGHVSELQVTRLEGLEPERMSGNRAKIASELEHLEVTIVTGLHLL